MPKTKQKTKTYIIQVTATVEITATYEMEGYSEQDAIERAENQLEMNLECSDSTAESLDQYLQDFTSVVVEEE